MLSVMDGSFFEFLKDKMFWRYLSGRYILQILHGNALIPGVLPYGTAISA